MFRTSLTDKLIFYYLLISITAVGIVGSLSYYKAKEGVFERTFDQLTSARVVKKRQVLNFLNDRIADIKFFSQSGQVAKIIEAMNENKDIWLFRSSAKDLSLGINYGFLKDFISKNKYYDRLIITAYDSPIIAEINKVQIFTETAFDKYEDSLLSQIRKEILLTGKTLIKENAANKTELKIYIASPVFNHQQKVSGMLLFEVDTKNLNSIMLENNPQEGVGRSGETYLVGNDFLMRTKSRFVEKSILKTIVRTKGVLAAITGMEGTALYQDYRNINVLGSFDKLNFEGLDWYVIAEIDLDEANVPILNIRNSILILSILISAIIFIFTFIISKKITVPVIQLTNAAKKIGDGKYDDEIEIKSQDEIGTLTSSFNTMFRKLKQQEIELNKERLKRSSAIIDAMENERKRLARELHDGLGQTVIALKLKLENIPQDDNENTQRIVRDVKKSIDDTIQEIRHISNNLMPAVLNEFGIVNAIRNLCDDLNGYCGIDIVFISDLHSQALDRKKQLYLFRIAQEALNNSVQHSRATNISVELNIIEKNIKLQIKDNGIGFPVEQPYEGNGLYNMRERVNLIGGEFNIRSDKESGTEIMVKIPC